MNGVSKPLKEVCDENKEKENDYPLKSFWWKKGVSKAANKTYI